MSSDTITTLDRYPGCQPGGAGGDALGAGVEFDEIAEGQRQ